MAVSWQIESVELLRHLINDVDSDNYLYTDTRLTRLLVVAGYQVLREAEFTQDFIVDISEQTITPDPTDVTNSTNDENFVNLMCLKAACILSHGVAALSANNAVAGKDTVSSWDLKGVAQYSIELLSKGICQVYDTALVDYLSSDGSFGIAVMGPFRTCVRNGHYYR